MQEEKKKKQVPDKKLVEIVILSQASRPWWELPSTFSKHLEMEDYEHTDAEVYNVIYTVCFINF